MSSEHAAGLSDERVWIPGPGGRIEGAWSYDADGSSSEGVLVLPPHPRLGGDLTNNVVRALASGTANAARSALRFNYRGVGQSEGPFKTPLESFRYWSAVMEGDAYGPVLEDARAALRWLRARSGVVHVVGYSFGAVLALRLAAEERVRSAAGVGLAIASYPMDFLPRVWAPVLLIHARDDFAARVEEVRSKASLLGGPWELEVFESTDHFFRGMEVQVARRVEAHLTRSSSRPAAPPCEL